MTVDPRRVAAVRTNITKQTPSTRPLPPRRGTPLIGWVSAHGNNLKQMPLCQSEMQAKNRLLQLAGSRASLASLTCMGLQITLGDESLTIHAVVDHEDCSPDLHLTRNGHQTIHSVPLAVTTLKHQVEVAHDYLSYLRRQTDNARTPAVALKPAPYN